MKDERSPLFEKNVQKAGSVHAAVVSKMETTAADGKKYFVKYYNLDAIIAVEYRVSSKKLPCSVYGQIRCSKNTL